MGLGLKRPAAWVAVRRCDRGSCVAGALERRRWCNRLVDGGALFGRFIVVCVYEPV